MRRIAVLVTVVGLLALAAVGTSAAVSGHDRGGDAKAGLTGYQETPSISTKARGDFRIRLEGGALTFRLRYRNLEGGNTLFAHIHFAERHVIGGVSAFLCGGGGKPACPNGSGDVEGTIAATDVLALQGIAAGQLDELVAAIRAGATYVNVHTATYPNGEIRGQISGRGHFGKRDD
jgi:hypothetical protein